MSWRGVDRKRGNVVTCSVRVPDKKFLNFMLSSCASCRPYCKEKPVKGSRFKRAKAKPLPAYNYESQHIHLKQTGKQIFTRLMQLQSFHLDKIMLFGCGNKSWRIKGRLNFRHRASCILGQAFRYSPENAFYIFNQQIYFIIWYLLDRPSLI